MGDAPEGRNTRGQLIKVPMLILFNSVVSLNTSELPRVSLPLENLETFLNAVKNHPDFVKRFTKRYVESDEAAAVPPFTGELATPTNMMVFMHP